MESESTTNALSLPRSGGRLLHPSPQLAARRAEHVQRQRMSGVHDWAFAASAPEVQLREFDEAVTDLHDAVAVANHDVWGDPLPPHLPGGAVQLRARMLQRKKRPDDVHATAAAGTAGAGERMPHGEVIQRSFGRHDISGVRAHTDAAAEDASRKLGAHGFAMGDHVAFAAAPDLHTAAHEAAHVVQQRAGVALKDGVGEAGDVYERHADEVAALVVRGHSAEATLDRMAAGTAGGATASLQRDEVAPGEGFDRDRLTARLVDLIDGRGHQDFVLDVAEDGTPQTEWKIADVAWRPEIQGLEELAITGFGDIAALLARVKNELLRLANGDANWQQAGFALTSRAVTVAKQLGNLPAAWRGLFELNLDLQALDAHDATARPTPFDEAAIVAYVEALLDASDELHSSLDSAAATFDLGVSELIDVWRLTLPGKAPLYVKDGEHIGYFEESEAQLIDTHGRLWSGYKQLAEEVKEQLRVDGDGKLNTLAAFLSQLLSDGPKGLPVGTQVDVDAVNALFLADSALAEQTAARGIGVDARLSSLFAAYQKLGQAAFKVEQYAALVDAWKNGKLEGAAQGLAIARTVRDICFEILAVAATGPLEAALAAWEIPSMLVKPLAAAAITFVKGTATELSEEGGDISRVDFVKIGKDANAAAASKALSQIKDALPEYARKLGYPKFTNEYLQEISDEVIKGAFEDAVDFFKGKEVSLDDFMGHIIKNIILAVPKKYAGDAVEEKLGKGSGGTAIKTVVDEHIDCGYDSAAEGKNACDEKKIAGKAGRSGLKALPKDADKPAPAAP